MKKILLTSGILLISFYGHSQILISILLGDKLNSDKLEFGLDGGVNFSSLTGIDQSKANATFNLGFYFDIKLRDSNFLLHTGLLAKSNLGAKDVPVYSLNDQNLDALFSTGTTIERRLSYFNVPVLAKHQFSNHFFYEIGPMFGLMHKATDVFKKKIIDKDDLQYTIGTRDNYHPLDAGLMAGFGYRLLGGNGMNLGIRYYYGLVDVTIDDTTADQFNRSFYLSVGIPIGGKKKTQEVLSE